MAPRFFQQERNTVSIVFSDHVIRFLELKQRSPIAVQQWGERYLDQEVIKDGRIIDQEAFLFILENCIDEWGIKKKAVRFIVPDQTIAIRKVTVPADIRDDEIKGYLFLEIGSTIHLPFENPQFDVFLLSANSTQKEVLLVAAEEEIVESYVNILEELKLKPVSADISPLSLYRYCYAQETVKEEDHIMLLQFDQSLLTISIFHQDVLVFMRPVPLNVQNELVKTGLSVMDAVNSQVLGFEDAFKDIEQIMSFYQFTLNQGSAQVNQILLGGDHPQLEEIQTWLEQRHDILIQQLSLENIITADGTPLPDSFTTILGLSLKEAVR